MINNTNNVQSSFVEINNDNELVINNKIKYTYKTNETNNKKNVNANFLQNKNEKAIIEHFFLSNKVDGSTINIIFG